MKKITIIMVIFLFFVFPVRVFADTCDNVDQYIEDYNNYKNYFDTECAVKNYDNEQICIDIGLQVDNLANKFINTYYSKDTPDSCKNKLEFIANDQNCGPLLDDLYEIVKRVMRYIYIIAPILLIIFVSIDLLSLLTSGGGASDKNASKIKSNIFKRLIAFILLYLMPTVVTFILSLNGSEYDLEGNYYTCNNTSNFVEKHVTSHGNAPSDGPKEDPNNPDCVNPDGTRTAGCKKIETKR